MDSIRIVEAVGYACKPGRNTIKADVARLFKRAFVWLLFRSCIPLGIRHSVMSGVFRLGQWLTGKMAVAGASKGNTFENDLLKLIFQAVAIADIAEDDTTSPLTELHVSLHTSNPDETGDQTSGEIAYTGYARVAVARTAGGWTVTNNSVSPAANIDFTVSSGGAGGTVTHFAVGTAASAAGKVLYYGTVTPNIVVSSGVIPRLTTASAITED